MQIHKNSILLTLTQEEFEEMYGINDHLVQCNTCGAKIKETTLKSRHEFKHIFPKKIEISEVYSIHSRWATYKEYTEEKVCPECGSTQLEYIF
jgi:DNA-directed RNA polymerase subunit M/transcription elongation factor TFIIS